KAPYLTIILGVISLKKTRSKFTQLSDNIGAITNKIPLEYQHSNLLSSAAIPTFGYWVFAKHPAIMNLQLEDSRNYQ
ncbi:hypothetical protein, partial [Cyclobacterium jeungdonense]